MPIPGKNPAVRADRELQAASTNGFGRAPPAQENRAGKPSSYLKTGNVFATFQAPFAGIT
jgi:hypothetical protein